MRSQILLFLVPAVLATSPRVRPAVSKGFSGQSKLVNVLAVSSCAKGYVTCENACMPENGVCCGDGTDEYCFEGYYCIPNACCPKGEICDGSNVGDAECALGETECGDLCMPITGTCCPDGLHYCPDFGTCTDDGYCCDIGDDCDGIGGGIFTSDLSTSTSISFTTHTSTTTTAQATTTASDDDDYDDDDETTTSSTSSWPSTTASSTTTADNPADTSAIPAPTNPVFQEAGGHFTADSKMAAGIAVVAAMFL
ncbi:hypothetical protein F4809DRAFT_60499 [Biscogniauxia mediterranea]|nr:hypothetical protein F4809DRAFT_60499 [Biscogniauxia mediterranea]